MKKSNKKLISLAEYDFLDSIIKDEAYCKNLTESAVVEKRLMESYLPQNINGNMYK